MKRFLTLIALGLWLVSTSVGAAQAQEPCEDLASNDGYQALVNRGIELLRGESPQPESAILLFQEAQQMCAFDPALTYYLARAYQAQENCSMAIETYRTAENLRASGQVAVSSTLEAKIASNRAEAEALCSVGRYAISCADAGVSLQFGDEPPFECSAEGVSGEREPGEVVLTAQLEGHESDVRRLDLQAGKLKTLQISALPEVRKAMGTLSLTSCPEGVASAQLMASSGESQAIRCPSTTDLEPGRYTVSIPESGLSQEFDVRGDRDVAIALQEPESSANVGAWLLTVGGVLVLGGGVALHFVAAGEVDDITNGCCTFPEAQDKQDTAEILNIVGIASMGLGGAMVVGGILMFALADDEPDDVDVSAAVSPEGVMFHLRARW